jgi:hypothetical protein
MREILGSEWDETRAGCSVWRLGEITFVGLDVRTGPEPTGFLSRESGEALAAVLRERERVVLCTHYPWFPTDNRRISEGLSVTNSERLHEILRAHRGKVIAAFHGHVHLWWNNIFAGIPCYCSTGSGMAFKLEPEADAYEQVIPQPLGYLLVGLGNDGSISVRPRYLVPE